MYKSIEASLVHGSISYLRRGVQEMPLHYSRIVVRDEPKQTPILFASGVDLVPKVWLIRVDMGRSLVCFRTGEEEHDESIRAAHQHTQVAKKEELRLQEHRRRNEEFDLRHDREIEMKRVECERRQGHLCKTLSEEGRFMDRQPAIATASKDIIKTTMVNSNDFRPRRLELERVHDDLIRDILVVSTSFHKLLLTGSLDSSIAVYDLLTLKFKYTRSTGVNNGVRCLAFDGRSLVLAGCLDTTILAWDLDIEINVPLFVLRGHASMVTSIFALPTRCFSLDISGEIRYWDSSINDITDGRLIDSKRRSDDRFQSFAVFTEISPSFDAVHNMMLVSCGRLAHTYRVVENSPAEEPPISILFSYELLIIFTIHPRDIFFWNAISGELLRRVQNVGGSSAAELTSAALNSKGQKMYVGDSSGTITALNCYNGVIISSMMVSQGSAVRFIIYTQEKLLLLLCGSSDLYAVDDEEGPEHGDLLRINRIADRYIVSMSFSAELGIIALADSLDTLMLFDFEFFSLELTIQQCTGYVFSSCLTHRLMTAYNIVAIRSARSTSSPSTHCWSSATVLAPLLLYLWICTSFDIPCGVLKSSWVIPIDPSRAKMMRESTYSH
jgi:WD40 repeat protein